MSLSQPACQVKANGEASNSLPFAPEGHAWAFPGRSP